MNNRFLIAGGVVALAAAASLLHPAPRPAAQPPAPAGLTFERAAVRQAAPATSAPVAVVYVTGAVQRAGVYTLRSSDRVEAALRAAGGAAPGADLRAVNLAARLEDGAEILVPVRGEAPLDSVTVADGGAATHRHRRHRTGGRGRHGRRQKVLPAQPIDINSASAEQLATLPGIGAGLASRIVAFRELNGRFGSVDDLLDVAGMTDARLQSLAPYVAVNR